MAAATWTRTRVKPKALAILVTVELSYPLRAPDMLEQGQALLGAHRLSFRNPVFLRGQCSIGGTDTRFTGSNAGPGPTGHQSVWHTLAQWSAGLISRLTPGCRAPAQYHHDPPVSFGTCKWYTCPTPAEIKLDQVPTGQSSARRAG